MQEWNEQQDRVQLVLFDDALEHLSRLHRILRNTGGHVLAVGVRGVGKACLIKLASFAANCDRFSISLFRGYREKDFLEELKGLYRRLGIENKRTVFLFSDEDIVDEGRANCCLLCCAKLQIFQSIRYLFLQQIFLEYKFGG